MDMSRRGFVGFLGAMGVSAAAASVALADEAKSTDAAADARNNAADTGKTLPGLDPTVGAGNSNDNGIQTLTMAELNDLRRAYIDSATEYTCADGTVIPVEWVRARFTTECYGLGVGSELNDQCFTFFQEYFSQDEAQAYSEMPLGVAFTAADYAEVSGRDEAECEEICGELAYRGLLMRWTRAGVNHYHHIAYAHGMWEYGLLAAECLDENADDFKQLDTFKQWLELHQSGEDLENAHKRADAHKTVFAADAALFTSETPFYYPIPVNKDIVGDEEILPHNDWEKIIDRNPVISVSTCQCRLRRVLQEDYNESCDHPMETCMSFGEEAQYYIDNNCGRQITQDEAKSILSHNVEVGMVIQSAYSNHSEVICSCHGDCCDILSSYVAIGAEGCAQLNSFPNLSHYTLQVDTDACIKCGSCADRCPMYAITMDDEKGPVVDAKCIRCGQCATVCPVQARKLVARDDYPELPEDMLADYNLKASYRFSHDMVHAPEAK